MAIRSFKDRNAEEFFLHGTKPRKLGWIAVTPVVKRKLDMVHYARALKDLLSPPSNRFEALKGNLREYYSIRINDQWRIIFKWDGEPYDVQVVDYH